MIHRLPFTHDYITINFWATGRLMSNIIKFAMGTPNKNRSETAARSEVWESSSKAAEFLASEFEDVLL